MKHILLILIFVIASKHAYSKQGEKHLYEDYPKDFILTYYMKDTISGSNLFLEIKKGKLQVDYINGVKKISKRKYYEPDEEEIYKLYKYMTDENFMEQESPDKTITQNSAAQYILGEYNGKENILIFSASADPPMFLLRLKYKLFELTDKYDNYWKRDMDVKYDVVK